LFIALLATGVILLAGSSPGIGAPVPGSSVLYTLDADFDQGTLVNVNHTAPNNNQLQLNTSSGTFPFIWVALSQRCTIAKINTETGAILGEFRTISDPVGCNESSRTTVGIDGSVWVGHRGPGGVTHVGLAELNQCVDRNGNGTIETSAAYGDVKSWSGADSNVANAGDECILHHVDTDAVLGSGFADSRHMSIDANNKLWVGSFNSGGVFVRVNGTTGAIETAPKDLPCGGYGGLIDSNGVIWSAQGLLLRWNPDAADDATNPRCISGTSLYGLAVDSNGWVWANQFGSEVRKVSPDGNTILGPFFNGSSTGSQGLAVDSKGDVWISSSLSCGGGCTIGHLKNDGAFVGNVSTPTGSGSTGIAVDAAGKIWAANRSSNTATRIDPSLGPLGCGGTGCADGTTHVGEVDLTVNFPATEGRPLPYPYNYSDMTGAQLFNSTAPQGTWTVVQDAGETGTAWGKVVWNVEPQGNVPAGSSLTVEARAADTEAGLGSQEYVAVTNGTAFSLTGRFIQARVTLKPNEEGVSPVLSDLRICSTAASCVGGPAKPPLSTPPADIGVTKVDSPDPVSVGSNLTYTLVVTNHGPGPAPDARMTDRLPAGVTFVSVATTRPSCSFAAGEVRCAFGTLALNETATVTIVVRVDSAGTLVNSATVGTTVADWNVGNNQTATAVTTAQGPFTPPATPTVPEAPAPAGCALTTGTPSVFAGVRSVVTVRARYDDGSARDGVAVTLRGAGKTQTAQTSAAGIARFTVLPKQAGRITLRGAGCGAAVAVASVMSQSCVGLSVTPKSATVGGQAVLSVRIRIAGKPAVGVRVLARGAGLSASGLTNSAGLATMRGTASRPGVIAITVPGVLSCSKRIGVSGAFLPPEVTG
jgi:uncharacterized repeat protein (TIGR01451 family)